MRVTSGRGVVAAATLCLAAAPLAAQSTSGGAFVGFGLGYGTAGMYASGRSNLKPGESLIGRVGLLLNGRPFLVADAEFQVYNATFPDTDAEFKALSLLGGIILPIGSEFYLTPQAGWQFRTWNGEEREVASDNGLLGSFGIGYHLSFSERMSVSPEVVGRLGDATGAGAHSYRGLGFRVVATWGL